MFAPYTIKHLQLRKITKLSLPRGRHYFVLWHNRIPLGHVWYDRKLKNEELINEIEEAIAPAVNHYLKAAGEESFVWRTKLFRDEETLSKICQILDKRQRKRSSTSSITVVICTRNRPAALRNCIEQLLKSKDLDFELLIVDNASDTDETERVVTAFPGVRYVREGRKGLSYARNTGIQCATGEIIACTDDDVLVPEDWISKVKEGFVDPLTMAITGLTIPAEIATNAQYIFERQWGFNKGYVPVCFDYDYVRQHQGQAMPVWDIGAGANMAFRKDIFKIVGGFDTRLGAGASGCSEDSEMWYRILAEGWNCCYNPEMVVYHEHRKTMTELRRQLYAYMKGHVSALLIQYERHGHVGNMVRIKKDLPSMYWYSLKRCILTLSVMKLRSLITEIKGCIAGWKFYEEHPEEKEELLFAPPAHVAYPNCTGKETLVTVIVTCYNYGHYLRQAIESIKAQTHTGYQIVVVDDGSTDQTAVVAQTYPEVVYVRTKHVGVSTARNAGIRYSLGEYVLFLDADDTLYPTALETQLAYFNRYRDVALVAGGFERVDELGTRMDSQPTLREHYDEFYSHLLRGNFIGMQSNTMYRRDLFYDFRFDAKLSVCEDYDLNLRISRYLPAYSHTERIVAYRTHSQSLSADPVHMRAQVLKVLEAQKPLLRTATECVAYEEGVNNWCYYYDKLIQNSDDQYRKNPTNAAKNRQVARRS
jgi:Glycosyltransferases involved in cell wall biogenesis